jgi:hypothetical protein
MHVIVDPGILLVLLENQVDDLGRSKSNGYQMFDPLVFTS